MTVKELKEMLERFSDDMEVCYAYPAKDYWNTTLAGEIVKAKEGLVKFSEYHTKWKIAEDNEDKDEHTTVVILQ